MTEQQHTMTTDYRALCAELLEALENAIRVIYHEDGTKNISTADAVIAKADTALAQPEPVGPTDEDYIDRDITGSDRVLLNHFYAGAQREGGSADEVTIRGIHAVLDLIKSTEPTHVELLKMWLQQYGDGPATMTFAEFKDAARAVLARWGRPALTPISVSERLPDDGDCIGNPRNGEGLWCWGREVPRTTAGTPVIWRLMPRECLEAEAMDWLPANALPLPNSTGGNS